LLIDRAADCRMLIANRPDLANGHGGGNQQWKISIQQLP
jgi:hypothetical protein